jgi:hypothetical protein
MKPSRAIYRKAADMIETYGKCNGWFWEPSPAHPLGQCPVCAIGALMLACGKPEPYIFDSAVAFDKRGWDIAEPLRDSLRLDGLSGNVVSWSDNTSAVQVVRRIRAVGDTLPFDYEVNP